MLLAMIEQRKNSEKPDEYFFSDNEFRAQLDVFRYKVRSFVSTGIWPDD
jgi:hypothetical protein